MKHDRSKVEENDRRIVENMKNMKKRPGIVEFLRAPSDAPNWVVLMLSIYAMVFALLIMVTRWLL